MSGPALSRREACLALLTGLAAVSLPTACTTAPSTPVADPERDLLTTAYLAELSLLAVLTAEAAKTRPEMANDRQLRAEAQTVLQQHLDRLVEVLGTTPPHDAPATVASTDFSEASKETAEGHLAGLEIAGPSTSQLLASLAASDLVLSEAFKTATQELR